MPEPEVDAMEVAYGNRRGCLRHKAHSPARVGTKWASVSASDAPATHPILDVSESGLSFRAASQIPVGRQLELCLDLPDAASSVWARGQVVWSDPSGRSGVRFARLRGRARRQIQEWLFMNALAACAQRAADQPLLAIPDPPALDEPGNTTLGPSSRALPQPSVLPQAEYAAILNRLAAIRREAEEAPLHLEKSLQLLAEQAWAFTAASGTAIAVADGADMICRASIGIHAPSVGARFQLDSGFSGQCVRTGTSLRCDDSEIDPRVDRESCRALGIRSILAVPILAADTVIGLLEVFSRQPKAFGVRDRIFLQRLADIIFQSIHRQARAVAVGPSQFAGIQVVDAAATTERSSNPLGFEELGGGSIFPSDGPTQVPGNIDKTDERSAPSPRWILWSAVTTLVVVTLFTVLFVRERSARSARNRAQLSAATNAGGMTEGIPATGSDMDRLRKSAGEGDAAAQFALGAHYAVGDIVGQNYVMAAQWFSQAADQGHVAAQATLGAYYWAGTGVPRDLNKAYFWSVLAEAGGDEASRYRVSALAGQMSHGQITAAREEANDWLRQHHLTGENEAPSGPDSHP